MDLDPSSPAPACLESVLATDALARRPQRAPDHAAENRAMAALAAQVAADPHGVPQKLADLLLALCRADSAGISLRDEEDGRPVFRWHAVAGAFAANAGGTVPYDASPCAPVVERNALMLLCDAGRCFDVLRDCDPPMVENLLAPWAANGRATGTVWVISHRPERQFDAEDARVLQSLAGFAAAAYQAIALERSLRDEGVRAAEEQVAVLEQHNRALRRSEARFRTLADTVPVLIWQNDDRGDNLFVNRYFQEFTGKRQEDLVGGGWRALVHPDDVAGYVDAVLQGAASCRPWRSTVRLRRHDGQWRWFDSHGHPVSADCGSTEDEVDGHVGAAVDITDTVLAEQALKDTDRRKDEFLAVLAHELRNPLAPISNAVHLLRHPDGRRRADRIVEMLGRQVRQIVKLVDDLLEISRITRDKIELHLQPVLLADAVHGAVETSRPLIDGGHHHVHVALPDMPVLLRADPVRLTQVLANLLNNAAKYTDPGGHIALAARVDGGEVEIAVRDDGIGIPPDQLPRVFDMFTQAHRAHGRGQGGLGIGLAMVRNLVQLHGGVVAARSAGPGRGSEFVVRLPLAARDEADPAAGPPAAAHAPLAGRRILVVDDNCDAADSLVMLLEADGADARAVYDGAAALEQLARFAPHVLLLDLGMPGMDGYEVARRVRAAGGAAAPQIVALTGWGQESDRARTRAAGFDFHLTKPVDLQALLAWLAPG